MIEYGLNAQSIATGLDNTEKKPEGNVSDVVARLEESLGASAAMAIQVLEVLEGDIRQEPQGQATEIPPMALQARLREALARSRALQNVLEHIRGILAP